MATERFPFPAYPNGWFRALYSTELAPGEVRRLHRLGRELVAFRGERGAAHVLDAHCPHLGAHLGVGGRVEGDALRCPFHAWLWSGEGRCLEIPYAKKIPPKARLRAWPAVERNGIVFFHHDAEGRPPAYEIPALPEHGSPDWTPWETRHWLVKSRWLDMNENAVDQVHFRYVHGTHTIPRTEAEADGPVLRCRSRMKMGTPRGEVAGGIDTTDHGPAFQVVRVTGIAETVMMNTATPVDADTTDVSFAYSVRRSEGDAHAGVGAALIRDLEKQMEQDIPIWEHKRHHPRPVLCDGDGPLGLYRRWMRQFFSAHSA
ncbi:MAG TPA: Rieske 2Fe-2S domain-containing protein [Myxococcota bacterium]|nr:Rieske 2Fe-2S domain-containing protein [Myxococcota bacterium]